LTPGQEQALAAHLQLKLPKPEADRLFWAIGEWFKAGGFGANPEARARYAESRDHMARVARTTRDLQQALRLEHPLWNTRGIDWPALDALLDRVAASAEAESPQAAARRGQPRMEWRDDLIALVHAHYPPDKLTVSWCSHFEETIRLVLGFLGEDIEDLHKQVRRTLKRGVLPSFTLRLG
jgi:hypothetical protein